MATIVDATVVGGADVPLSNNGPLTNIIHTAGTATIKIATSGQYLIEYDISTTAGIGSSIAIAVNGTVDASTNLSVLVATGTITGSAILTLAATDEITLRNNSATAITLALAPIVGAQINLIQLA